MKVVDRLLIGGAMAYTFLRAHGEPTGKSLVEEDKIDLAKDLLAEPGDKLMLPVDHVVASEFKAGAENEVVERIPDGKMALDIGPETIAAYSSVIAGAKTIIWNGPMGVFEMPPFDKGTVAVAKAVAESGAMSVVGGGDSEKAVKSAGVPTKSRTSPPAAARRSNSWPASNCPAWRRSTGNKCEYLFCIVKLGVYLPHCYTGPYYLNPENHNCAPVSGI